MALPVQYFTITPAEFEKLKQQASGAGFAITMNAGQATYRDCTITWNYDPANGSLSMQCTDKPWYIPSGFVMDKIQQWVEAAG